MKKVLIITYYWPPAGGAGVQRWVKLSDYLLQFNIQPIILTVNEAHASYMTLDHSLSGEVNKDIKVYKTKSFEPINLYAKLVGKDNVPTAGFSNVNNEKFSQKLINAVRSNLFIPDPRKGWNKFAYKKAKELIKNENIDVVITTSPPHSTQLIGLKLKKKLKIKWIADLRDPWTDIYYYKLLNHSVISSALDRRLEKRVLLNSDRIVTVSEGFKSIFESKNAGLIGNKISVIPNGFDAKDFYDIKKTESNDFVISYTGTISEQYQPYFFIDVLKKIIDSEQQINITLQFIGITFDKLKAYVTDKGLDKNVHFIPTVSHKKSVEYISTSQALLLIIPDVSKNKGIVPGKLYEYLATGNPIICIGNPESDAAEIIAECNAGYTFIKQSEAKLEAYIRSLIEAFSKNDPVVNTSPKINNYSREAQARKYARLIIPD